MNIISFLMPTAKPSESSSPKPTTSPGDTQAAGTGFAAMLQQVLGSLGVPVRTAPQATGSGLAEPTGAPQETVDEPDTTAPASRNAAGETGPVEDLDETQPERTSSVHRAKTLSTAMGDSESHRVQPRQAVEPESEALHPATGSVNGTGFGLRSATMGDAATTPMTTETPDATGFADGRTFTAAVPSVPGEAAVRTDTPTADHAPAPDAQGSGSDGAPVREGVVPNRGRSADQNRAAIRDLQAAPAPASAGSGVGRMALDTGGMDELSEVSATPNAGLPARDIDRREAGHSTERGRLGISPRLPADGPRGSDATRQSSPIVEDAYTLRASLGAAAGAGAGAAQETRGHGLDASQRESVRPRRGETHPSHSRGSETAVDQRAVEPRASDGKQMAGDADAGQVVRGESSMPRMVVLPDQPMAPRTQAAPEGTAGAAPLRDAPNVPEHAEAPKGPFESVSVRVTNADGTPTRIRVAVRGDEVRTTIIENDAGSAQRMVSRGEELQQSLAARGFSKSSLSVHGSGVRVPDAAIPTPQQVDRPDSGGSADSRWDREGERSSHRDSPQDRQDTHRDQQRSRQRSRRERERQ